MKVKETNSNEAKLLEEKREQMNKLIGLNNISIKENLTLLINTWCAEHIKTLHKEYPSTEWLAICKVVPVGKGTFLMTDMLFPGQKGVGGEVETTQQGMEWLTKELIERGENLKDWNCVLHSHHSMGCFWSPTDDNARLSLNDGRQLAWAVVSSYKGEEINYKGCLNFYKPYNIEIDATVRESSEETVVARYNEYQKTLCEKAVEIYENLVKESQEYIDSITEKPSYSRVLDYLGLDISQELNENYNQLKDKVGNPELLDYFKQLESDAEQLAIAEINKNGEYNDMLAEYDAFCDWSDNLLNQLSEHREKSYTFGSSIISSTLNSQTNYPLNRDFNDMGDKEDDYYFTGFRWDEFYVRQTFGIGEDIPMKLGMDGEWLAWSNTNGQYMYVEDWAEELWG